MSGQTLDIERRDATRLSSRGRHSAAIRPTSLQLTPMLHDSTQQGGFMNSLHQRCHPTPVETASHERSVDPVADRGRTDLLGCVRGPGLGLPARARRASSVRCASSGLAATEFGPDGFLADDPQRKAAQLAAYDMKAVGGFLPVLLHDPDHDPLPQVDAFIDACIASGAGVVVLAAFTGVDGYDDRPELDELGWKTLLGQPRPARRPRREPWRDRVAAPAHGHDGRASCRGRPRARRIQGRPLRRHRPHRRRGRRPGRRSRPRTPTGSRTSTSRTSTQLLAERVIARRAAVPVRRQGRHLPPARARRRRHRCAGDHARGCRLPAAGTCSSRT